MFLVENVRPKKISTETRPVDSPAIFMAALNLVPRGT